MYMYIRKACEIGAANIDPIVVHDRTALFPCILSIYCLKSSGLCRQLILIQREGFRIDQNSMVSTGCFSYVLSGVYHEQIV
jgi:hypothetical protein